MLVLVLQIIALLLAAVYIIGIYRLIYGLRRLNNPAVEIHPAVSIIVSLHNEENNLPDLMKHLLAQNYPSGKLEIILVDDRSDDNTLQLLQEYELQHAQIKLIQIKETPKGFAPKKYALTRAIELAKGEILCFTDADGRPGQEWIKTLAAHFDNNTGMVIGYAPYMTDHPYNHLRYRLLALEYLSHAAVAASSTGLHYPVTCVGTNLAYRKKVFVELGGFGKFSEVHSGDDDLFLQRVRDESDWKIRYAADAGSHVHNAPPQSWTQFYHQRLRYASKGFLYPGKLTLILSFFYLYNFLIFLNLVMTMIAPVWLYSFLILFVIKLLSDYLFMTQSGNILHDTRNVFLIPVAVVLHIPYVLWFGLMAQIQGYQWAGRNG